MKRFLFGLACLVVLALCSASSGWAAASGTAWGIEIGAPGHDDAGYHLQLHVDGLPGGDQTIVDCGAWSAWCAGIQSNETVIVSFTQKSFLYVCGVTGNVLGNSLQMDGVSKSHYCYPGPCGT